MCAIPGRISGSIRTGLGNFIVYHLPSPSLLGDKLIEIAVQLQGNAWSERDIAVIRMDCGQHIPISDNLLLRTILWCDLVLDQLLDAIRRRLDPLRVRILLKRLELEDILSHPRTLYRQNFKEALFKRKGCTHDG